jgi:hypothetical protein
MANNLSRSNNLVPSRHHSVIKREQAILHIHRHRQITSAKKMAKFNIS